ncbi:MAG: hypothetical protein WCG60_02775 [bacterium]
METQNITPQTKDSKPIKKKMSNWKLLGIFIFLFIIFAYLMGFVLSSAHLKVNNRSLVKYTLLTTNQKAKLYFGSIGSYLGVCGSKDFFVEIQNSFSVTSNQIVCNDNEQEYALSFIANSKPDIYLCFDISGKSVEISTNIISQTSCPVKN